MIHYCADFETIETFFRTIISVNQLSLYGAVAEMCEQYDTFHDRTERPVVGGQSSLSFVPSVIKTDVLLDCDDRAYKDLLLQRYRERIEKLSQQDRSSKFCNDAGFPTTVELKNSQIQWLVVSTPCQETKIHVHQKVGFGRTLRVGPYWKLRLVADKVNMEWKSELSL